jgi:hypothetical protein
MPHPLTPQPMLFYSYFFGGEFFNLVIVLGKILENSCKFKENANKNVFAKIFRSQI